jgi:hypothetical protein
VTDNGPFAETKGAMAGTYVLKARDLGHARALASMTPGTDGEVEVRPIFGSPRRCAAT